MQLIPREILQIPLKALTDSERSFIVDVGIRAGLKMYHFKKKDDLPRVSAVLGFLRGVRHQSLLDVGSGGERSGFPFCGTSRTRR